jgi:hypothetical protein
MTDRIIAALLYLYPPRWRHEYSDEFADVLRQRPLTPGVALEVAWRGVCQRWHDGGPVLAIGFLLLPWVSALVVQNLLFPRSYIVACRWGLLHDTRYLVPSVEMVPGGPNFYAVVLMACGLITRLRERVPLWRSGVAATQLAAVAGLPVMILGLLLMAGVVDLHVITRTTATAPVAAPGWTYTYCSEEGRVPSSLTIYATPLLRLPQAFVYGLFGGWIASLVRHGFRAAERV